jgi:hypothetical protein
VVFQDIVCLCLCLGREIERIPLHLYSETFQCAHAESHCTCPPRIEFILVDFLIYFFHLWLSFPSTLMSSSSQPILLDLFSSLEDVDVVNFIFLNEFGESLKKIMEVLTSTLRNHVSNLNSQYRSISKCTNSSCGELEFSVIHRVTNDMDDIFHSYRNHSCLTERFFKLFDIIYSDSVSWENSDIYHESVDDEASLPFVVQPHFFANYLLRSDFVSGENPPKQIFHSFTLSVLWATITDTSYSGGWHFLSVHC